MLLVLSPAKSLDFTTPAHIKATTQPQFIKQSTALIKILRTHDAAQLSEMMHISNKLAELNVARNDEWRPKFDESNAKQAILAFNGDVYDGFAASDLAHRELQHAQKVVRILSGLYGILRPLDLMRAYRLEMGTSLANAKGKDLYAFWGSTLAKHLSSELDEHRSKYLIHLASEEYFKAIPIQSFKHPIVQPIFKEGKNGTYKIISFFAKRARGVMARYIVQNKIDKPELLKSFSDQGYRFDHEHVTKTSIRQLVFVRN